MRITSFEEFERIDPEAAAAFDAYLRRGHDLGDRFWPPGARAFGLKVRFEKGSSHRVRTEIWTVDWSWDPHNQYPFPDPYDNVITVYDPVEKRWLTDEDDRTDEQDERLFP
jgi:hypothetical protein